MKIEENVKLLRAALAGKPGELDAWLEVNNEKEVKETINLLIEQEKNDAIWEQISLTRLT